MAEAKQFEKCALIAGILSTIEDSHDRIIAELEKHFGPVLEVSKIMDFPYTDYYDNEMEGHPVRYIILFKNLVDPSLLAEIKSCTNEIEKIFRTSCGRRVNIDPGLLSLSSLILATCKNRAHRIPLSNGIYAEVTLIYQGRDFQSLEWTYADYSSPDIKEVLRDFRTKYKNILRNS